MRWKWLQTESLDDLTFRFRNREYGAYYLRRFYSRYLIFSMIIGVSVFLAGIFAYIIIQEIRPAPVLTNEISYVFEYPEMAPPIDNLPDIPRPYEPPEAKQESAPVVSDTVKEEETKPPEPEPEETKENADSASGNPGGALNGTGAGDSGGLSTTIDVFPRYPGGDEARLWYLRRNLRYPEVALKARIQGVVLIYCIVETDGTISNVKVEKGIGGGCDEEAVRVVKDMPRWEPGKRNGKPVRVQMRIPIVFSRAGA